MIQFYRDIMGMISNTVLFGMIPLDILMHVFVSVVIYNIGLKLKFKDSKVFGFIAALTGMKEILDSAVLNYTFDESIKDIFFSLIYPVIAFFLGRIKLKKQNS